MNPERQGDLLAGAAGRATRCFVVRGFGFRTMSCRWPNAGEVPPPARSACSLHRPVGGAL